MTSWAVSDSGVFLTSVLPEMLRANARALLQHWDNTEVQLAAPVLFHYEIVAVIRKNVFRGRLTPDEGVSARDVLLQKPIQLLVSDHLLRRGYDLATRFNLPTAYDAQYLAVAEYLDCEFWTTDQRLFNTVSHELPWVKWLGNFGS